MENHPWERDDDLMWYRIEYFDGKEIKYMFLSPGIRRAKLSVYKGKTVVVAARPLSSLSAASGYLKNNSNRIELKFENSKLSNMFLSFSKLLPEAASFLDLELLESLIGQSFNDNKVLDLLLSGEIDSIYSIDEEKSFLVEIEDIPQGWWFPENQEEGVLVVRASKVAKLDLIPGAFKYYNFELNLMLSIIVEDNGNVYSQVKPFDIWY